MINNYKLYIDGNEVEFTSNFETTFIYQVADLNNPTAVKNSFSKALTIDGTPNNNKIFGNIYNLERIQEYKFNSYSNIYFDASKRTPFELYLNDDLIESGYMQLNKINISNCNNISYAITLYGGLGDAFYNLMYDDNGVKKTLSDLCFFPEKDKETELNFNINKDFVKNSWLLNANNVDDGTVLSLITFVPCYNGLYENFSNDTFLINTNQNNNFTETSTDGFSAFNGYKLGKSEKEFTEWEINDLRSYMQRPAIRVKKLLNAIFDSTNNGGYTFQLDDRFFNADNPYYNDSWMALPMLFNSIDEVPGDVKKSTVLANSTYPPKIGCETINSSFIATYDYFLNIEGDVNSENGAIDLTPFPTNSDFNINVDFTLNFTAVSNILWNNGYLSFSHLEPNKATYYYRSILVQLRLVDANDVNNIYYYSDVYNFSNTIDRFSAASDWVNYPTDYKNKFNFVNVDGHFKRGNGINYTFEDNNGNRNFKLTIKNIRQFKNCRLVFDYRFVYNRLSPNVDGYMLANSPAFAFDSETDSYALNPNNFLKGYSTTPIFPTSQMIFNLGSVKIASNKLITKKDLLKTDFTPAQFLLDYCKMFGLLFVKDRHSKTIHIITKNKFYQDGQTIDISDKIDWNNIDITPQMFDSKYFLMKSKDSESYYTKKYKDTYSLEYGQQRINTNNNFSQEEKEILKDTIFQNTITVVDTSNYYYTYTNKNGDNAPCWISTNPRIVSFKNVQQGEAEKQEITLNYNNVLSNIAVPWNDKKGYDCMSKVCCYKLDKSIKSISDINCTLLIYNGMKPLKDADGENISYWLTDDVAEMSILNDGNNCYISTDSEYNKNGDRIAYKYNELPHFTRYKIRQENEISESFDFGVPKEIFIPNVTYNETETLYNRYWDNYINDIYDVNTRKVVCNVNFDDTEINQDMLKNFYFFNGSYWIINKIENRISTLNKYLAKVEFIKVNEINNYKNAQFQYQTNNIEFSEKNIIVDWNTAKYALTLTATNEWEVTDDGTLEISPLSGTAGETTIEIMLPINSNLITGGRTNEYTILFECMHKHYPINIKQLPNYNYTKHLHGYVYDEATNKAITSGFMEFNGKATSGYYYDDAYLDGNGYYSVYLPLRFGKIDDNITVYIYDFVNDKTVIKTISYNSINSNEDYNIAI